MKKNILLTVLMLPLMLVNYSCQKEFFETVKEPLPGINALRALLTRTGGWEFSKIIAIYGPGDIDDGPLDACKRDDRYYFRPNGNTDVLYGSNACVPGAETSGIYGTWELTDNGTRLKQVYTRRMPGNWHAGDKLIWTVDLLTDEKLVMRRTETELNKTYIIVETYIR